MTDEVQTPSLAQALDLVMGEEVTILPIGSQDGSGFRGVLVNLFTNEFGLPVLVQIRDGDKPCANIPWSSIVLISRPLAPAVVMEANKAAVVETPSVADLVAMAGEIGLDVPDDIRTMLETPGL